MSDSVVEIDKLTDEAKNKLRDFEIGRAHV